MGDRPLTGVRVVELGGIGPVPFAGMQLADLGADVVRVDRPAAEGAPLDPLSRGKRSVAIDLQTPTGVALALSLCHRADVVIEGFRPGVAERLGVGPDECQCGNPALVYGRMTGYGQSGPLATVAGHDINYIGLTGALHAIGRSGQAPAIPLFLVGDLGGGSMFLLMGVLAALHRAGLTGQGDVVDAAIVDGASQLMATAYAGYAAGEWVDRRAANMLDSGRPWYDVYETADGKWLSVGAIEDKFYAELVRLLELSPDECDRSEPERWPVLREQFAARFASRTRSEWERVFALTEACVAPVLSLSEAPQYAQLAARQTFVDAEGRAHPGSAPRFRGSPRPAPGTLPRIGEHTSEVAEAWGVTSEKTSLAMDAAG